MTPPCIEILYHHLPKPIQRVEHLIIKEPTQSKMVMNKFYQLVNRITLNITQHTLTIE
jgi:hypothetical protein